MTKKKKKIPKSTRRPIPQLLIRLGILALVLTIILIIGMVRYGWQPLGAKTSGLEKAKTSASKATRDFDSKVKAVADKLKTHIDKALPDEKSDDEKTINEKQQEKDAKALKDFLEKEVPK